MASDLDEYLTPKTETVIKTEYAAAPTVDRSRCHEDSHDQLWSKQPPAVADDLVKTVITTPFTGYAIDNKKPVRRKRKKGRKS